jgi:hypothetical protein
MNQEQEIRAKAWELTLMYTGPLDMHQGMLNRSNPQHPKSREAILIEYQDVADFFMRAISGEGAT